MTTALDLDTLVLDKGAHDNPAEGVCVMEAVAFLAGEKWSDSPDCASPVLGAFLRSWNDTLPDDDRQELKRYIFRLVGSRGTAAQEDERAWLAMDWLVRTYTPVWLRFAATTAPRYAEGLAEHADRLAALPAGAAARVAAGAAAWDAELQAAAHELVERMLAVTEATA